MKLYIFLFLFFPLSVFCQQKLTEEEAVSMALKNSALIQSGSLEVLQSKKIQKTAFDLSNPEIMMESPTGEFQTVGVIQSIDFPTVYFKQHQLIKQQTKLAEAGQKVTENDVKYKIRNLYLALQYAEYVHQQYKVIDSIFSQLSISAKRQHEAGQINFLEATLAETQYGEIHNQFAQSEKDVEVLRSQLKIYTNSAGPVTVTELKRTSSNLSILEIKNDSSMIRNNPSVLFSDQQQLIGKKTLALEKNRFLPGFTFGYLNQAGRNTPMDLRFRAGINIPVWFWQYTGSIGAAKIGVKIAEQKSLAQRQFVSAELQKAQGDYLKYDESLRYYENKGIRLTEEILSASKRFFESGKENYTTHLKNINDAYVIRLRYAESLRNFNQSVININYLAGTL